MKRGNNEGSVYRRQDGRWVACITLGYANGKRQRKTAMAASKREANQELAQLQHAAEQGLALGPDPALGEYLRRWLQDSARMTLRPRTFNSYRAIVELHLIPALGRIPLRKLSPGDVEAYVLRIVESGLSTRTAQYHHAVLRRALTQAERWGLVSRNAARLVTPPRVQRRDVRPLTPGQARVFLAGVEGDRLEALYAVSLSLGLRQGEALGLQWADVDLAGGTLTVRYTLQRYDGEHHLDEPKTARSRRTISIPTPLVDTLRRHKVQQNEERLRAGPLWVGDGWNLVFCNEIGEPLDGTAVTRAFQRKLADLGLPRQRFHDLRHAAATFLIAQGVPLRVVMEILGHSTITTTADTYGHVMPELQRDATDRVAAILFGAS